MHHCHKTYEVSGMFIQLVDPVIGLCDSHQVQMDRPKVTKNPATQPRTLQLQARARIAKQTYSPNRRRAVFCQLNVLYLMS